VKINLAELPQLAKTSEATTKKFFSRLKKNSPKNLDIVVKEIHNEVFQNINCLDCANCCKSISPIVTDKDIERVSKFLKLRPSAFTEKYLHIDEDNDYVFNFSPCPFLDENNFCKIYDARPKACSEYPHTDRKHFIQIFDLTIKNTFICPAAFEIVEQLKKKMN